ncbi:hypothetical protein ABK040_006205 [Willaertia magna]
MLNPVNYTLHFDTFTEQFDSNFPIFLQNRMNQTDFQFTIQECSNIMKKHMKEIESNTLKQSLIIFVIIFASFFLLTLIPLLIFFLAYDGNGGQAYWVWIAFPILYCFVVVAMVAWSVHRRHKIQQRHALCKEELINFLTLQNNTKFQMIGVQFVLKYNTAIVYRQRFVSGLYKFLIETPKIEVWMTGGQMNTTTLIVQQPPVMMQNQQQQPPLMMMDGVVGYQSGYNPMMMVPPQQQSVAYYGATTTNNNNENDNQRQPLLDNQKI